MRWAGTKLQFCEDGETIEIQSTSKRPCPNDPGFDTEFPFLKLSIFLRRKIYRYTLDVQHTVEFRASRTLVDGLPKIKVDKFTSKNGATKNLLDNIFFKLNRQIRQELFDFIFETRKVRIIESEAAIFLRYIGDMGRKSLNCLEIMQFQGRASTAIDSLYNPYISLLHDCPKLNRLELQGDLAFWNESRTFEFNFPAKSAQNAFWQIAPEIFQLRNVKILVVTAMGGVRGNDSIEIHCLRFSRKRSNTSQLVFRREKKKAHKMVCSADFVRSVRLTYAGPIASWKIIRARYSYVTLMVYTMGGVCTMNHTCLSLIQITLLSTHTVFLSMSRIEAFSPIRSAFAEFTVPLDLPSSNSLQHLFSVRDSLHTYDFLTNVEDKYSAKPYRDGS